MKNKSSKIIALHGSYYFQNFGDLLMLDIMTKWIKEYNSEYKVILPDATEEITKIVGADGYGRELLSQADALIYGGGGYLGEPPTKKILWGVRAALRHAPLGNIMRKRNKPYAIIGVGVGPLTNRITRKAFTKLCRNAEVLAVRDKESRNYLIEYGLEPESVIQTSDMVMQLSRNDIEKKYLVEAERFLSQLTQPIKIGVHLGANPFNEKTELLKNEIIKFAKNNKNIGLVLLRDGSGSHPQVHDDIEHALPEQTLKVTYENHWYFTSVLANLHSVLTTKLHVGITSTALGKTALSIYAHGKTPRFYKQINASENCISLKNLKNGQVESLIKPYLERGSNTSLELEEIIEKSKDNKKLVFSFLERI